MDVLGNALEDYFLKRETDTLWLHNSYDTPEEMPIGIFFRTPGEMPELELTALAQCTGNILDIGAGAGSHALFLQHAGKDVTALDRSAKAVQIMEQRGVKKVINEDIFKLKQQQYNTLLFLMNGIGLTGSVSGFKDFLITAKTLLKPGGKMLFDSSDISYLYQQGLKPPKGKYYGEVSYCYEYKGQKDNWFNWLYIDKITLQNLAEKEGWAVRLLYDDGEDQYLAELTIRQED